MMVHRLSLCIVAITATSIIEVVDSILEVWASIFEAVELKEAEVDMDLEVEEVDVLEILEGILILEVEVFN